MATCVRCGREMPSFTFGDLQDTCPECRRSEAQPVSQVNRPLAPYDAAAAAQPAPIVPARSRLTVTHFIVGANLAIFALMATSGLRAGAGDPFSFTIEQLLKWGANYGPLSLGNEFWRLLSNMWVHGGLLHVALNMWCLWGLGKLAERVYGRGSFIALYTISGVAGSLASLAWNPNRVSVGASAAIFGVAGALIPPFRRGLLPIPQPALRQISRSLLSFVGYNLLIGFVVPVIDNSAHIGGLLGGLAIGYAYSHFVGFGPGRDHQRVVPVLGAVALATVALFVLVRQLDLSRVAAGQAAMALERRQPDEALSKAQQALARKPSDSDLYAIIGGAYFMKQRYAEAEQSLQKALELNSNNEYALQVMAELRMQQGNYSQAYSLIQKAAQLDPKDADIQADLAGALDGIGRRDEALRTVKAALAANSKNAYGQSVLGHIRAETNDPDGALAAYQEAARLEPDNISYQRGLASAYETKRMMKEAAAVKAKIAELEKSGSPTR